MTLIYDATDAILGRFASRIAKELLLGEKIAVLNAEKIIISGQKKSIIKEYKTWLQIRTATAPWRGPNHPRRPDRLFKRTVRGMLPRDNTRGSNALKRLKVYIGEPDEFKEAEKKVVPEGCNASRLNNSYFELGALSKELGWSGFIK